VVLIVIVIVVVIAIAVVIVIDSLPFHSIIYTFQKYDRTQHLANAQSE